MTGTKGDSGDNDTWAGLNGTNGDSQKKEQVSYKAGASQLEMFYV